MMKKNNILTYAASAFLLSAFCLASCKSDEDAALSGEGKLRLSVSASDKINVVSRTLTEEAQQQLETDCKIRIFNSEYLVQKYEGTANIPSELILSAGSYKATAYAGDSVAASFDKCFYYGEEEFEIKKGTVSPVNVACSLGNTVVAINISDDMLAGLSDYTVTISSAEDSLKFTADNIDQKGYFTPPTTDRNLKCVLRGTSKMGTQVYVSQTIRTERTTLYTFNFQLSGSVDKGDTGGLGKPYVYVNAYSLKPTNHEFSLTQRVNIFCKDKDGLSCDLSQAMHWSKNSTPTYTLEVAAYNELKSISITLPEEAGLSASALELLSASDEVLAGYSAKGLSFVKPVQGEDNVYRAYIQLDTLLTHKLSNIGEITSKDYKITISASETASEDFPEGRSRTTEWNISVSDDKVQTVQNASYNAWASKAVLYGKVVNAEEWSNTPRFRYRACGSTDWTTADATLSGETFSATVTGLTPATAYEYQALDDEQASSITCTFTTESLFQPENAGFEKTSGSSPLYFYGSGESMWWDSGNKGSAKMNKNVTKTSTDYKHGGNQSLYMESQFVGVGSIGKFAAGNIFSGEFLDIENTYYGILGWGRPCTSRPKALRVWVRYSPGTVNYGGSQIANGATDQGIIYVAVGDWTSTDATYGKSWPVVVHNQSSDKLFNPKDKGTIGYGEQVFTTTFGTNESIGMAQVEIPLDYDNYGGNNRKPTHIIIVGSASRYGDYYLGSTSSRMWLDDMELVYE